MANYPQTVQKLIDAFSRFPGIGPKSAARLVFYILHAPSSFSQELSDSVADLKQNISFCKICRNLAEGSDTCLICQDEKRTNAQVLVVEDVLDLYAFEKVGDFNGRYHVLGGVISPVAGIGPEELNLASLFRRVRESQVEMELIVATNPNLEGEATAMYIKNELADFPLVKITRIARGLPTGADLDYADSLTLKRSLQGRTSL